MNSRLARLEAMINPAGSWSERTPLPEKLNRWQAAAAQGLHLDFRTGDIVNLEELRRRDPEGAALIARNTEQFTEAEQMFGQN